MNKELVSYRALFLRNAMSWTSLQLQKMHSSAICIMQKRPMVQYLNRCVEEAVSSFLLLNMDRLLQVLTIRPICLMCAAGTAKDGN